MPKPFKTLAVGLFLSLVLFGCDIFSTLDFSDAKGEWTYPSITQIGAVAVHEVSLSVMGDSKDEVFLDIRWTRDTDDEYFLYMANGAMDGDTFTGTYRLNSDWDTIHNITVKFTKSGDQLKIECSGTGGLNGITLSGGVLADV